MIKTKLLCLVALAMILAPLLRLVAQVQTDVPPPVPGFNHVIPFFSKNLCFQLGCR